MNRESNEADLLEQQADLAPDRDVEPEPIETAEADRADVREQQRAVPDDEERGRG